MAQVPQICRGCPAFESTPWGVPSAALLPSPLCLHDSLHLVSLRCCCMYLTAPVLHFYHKTMSLTSKENYPFNILQVSRHSLFRDQSCCRFLEVPCSSSGGVSSLSCSAPVSDPFAATWSRTISATPLSRSTSRRGSSSSPSRYVFFDFIILLSDNNCFRYCGQYEYCQKYLAWKREKEKSFSVD